MAYPNTAALVTASSVEALTSLNSTQQGALRDAAIAAVERFARQSFATAAEETVEVDGNGLTTIYLPKRLADFTGIEISGSAVDAEAYKLNMARNRLSIREDGSWGTWADRAAADFDSWNRDFPIGSSNIAITGTWGWTDAEYTAELAAVTTAIRYAMEDLARLEANELTEVVRTARSLGLASVSQGDLSADLSRREPDLPQRAKRLLAGKTPSGEKLRFPRGAGAVV